MGNILKKYNLTKAQWEVVGGAITGDTLPIGSIIPFGGTEAPTGWLICDGSMLNRETYKELFAAIGTNFGTDGPGNFYIPDLRGKVAVGQDTTDSDFGMGAVGGSKEMQYHKHGVYVNRNTGQPGPGSYYPLAQVTEASSYIDTNAIDYAGTGNSGNLQPYQVTNYIIKAFQSAGVVAQVSNTKSDSTTDTYSCDYVNELEEWTQLTASGATSITLPENYKEIRVIVINNAYQNWYIGTFTKDFLITAGDKYYRIGHYTTSSDNSSCTIRIKSDLVVLADAYINGSDRTSTSTVYVYYR